MFAETSTRTKQDKGFMTATSVYFYWWGVVASVAHCRPSWYDSLCCPTTWRSLCCHRDRHRCLWFDLKCRVLSDSKEFQARKLFWNWNHENKNVILRTQHITVNCTKMIMALLSFKKNKKNSSLLIINPLCATIAILRHLCL